MKNFKMTLFAALLCVLLLSGCTIGETTGTSTDMSGTNTSARSEDSSSNKESSAQTDNSDSVENKNIKIASWKLSKDYNGKDVLVVEYEWTNTKDDAANFMTTFTDMVYQNGVECNSTVIGCDDVDTQKQMNDVKPGVTYNVAVGYLLQDNTNATIVVSELFGDEVINEIIELGGSSNTSSSSGEIVETSIKITGHLLSKDYEGSDVLVVNYEFYNGEDSANGFSYMFNDKAYQNGVECDSMVIGCDDVDAQSQLNKIQPGVSYIVSVGYHISDKSDVEIEVKDLLGTKDYLNETISLS